MSGDCHSGHEDHAAKMRKRGKEECIRASRAVSAKKIARAPGKHRGQAEIRGQR